MKHALILILTTLTLFPSIGSLSLANHGHQHFGFMKHSRALLQQSTAYNFESNGEFDVMKKFITQNATVFDVGASIGEWSRTLIATSIKPGTVYAFEPQPNSFAQLASNLAYASIKCLNLAVSDQCGTAEFCQFTGSLQANELSSLFHRPLNIPKATFEVATTTLDEFCAQQKITHIDFLKIDTEGAELAVLNGAQVLITLNAIDYIQFEYGGTYKDAGTTLREVCALLTKSKYRIFKICRQGLVHIASWQDYLEDFNYSNYLAIIPEKSLNFTCTTF